MASLPQGSSLQVWTRPDPRVICLGLSALDHIWTLPDLPTGPGKLRAAGFVWAGGGMAATAAVAVARLGGRAAFWGRAGEDVAGRVMQDELAREGVDVAAFRLFAGGRSSVSGVMVDPAGERLIANFRGLDLADDPGWLPLDLVTEADAVLADPRWPDGAARLFRAARAAGVPTVLDADVAEPEVFDLLLPLTDHAIFSAPALAAYAGSEMALERIAAEGCIVAAVTLGAAGLEWLEAGERRHRPAFAVPVVDTTGAGDVFHGAWAFAVGAGASVADAAGFASAAAALKCTQATGRAGIPTFPETLDLWRRDE